ncbi:MAG: isoaspartyl peptidase/L-asparaginase family protein [Thiohalobacterales bacterium]|nr:isoaspartyl peptidase/L-asparaginase family protein [Thiohalobacterales bacterium]
MQDPDSYSIMVHGGAGALDNVTDDKMAVRYLESIRRTLEHGREILQLGGSALQAVEACASLLEDDPVFNAGCGSVLNEDGKVEMDAAIMDGRDLSAGAVAGVSNIANPVQLARQVMTESEHVLLIAEGAMRFADHCGIERVPEHYFYTPDRVEQLKQARLRHKVMLDHDDSEADSEDQKYGTIGAVARDPQGNLAAATSTGGVVNKRMGRVGDSPIVGAGVYADNETCAVSATGYGEDFMRTVISKTIADFMLMKGMDAAGATAAGIDYLSRKVTGRGGVIVIDGTGRCASGFTTKKMIHGWIEHGGEAVVRF